MIAVKNEVQEAILAAQMAEAARAYQAERPSGVCRDLGVS